jgi:hypothetical protein
MLTRDAQPLGSKCYWLQAGESFVTIASKVNLSPLALIRYNFGTSDAAEVNWYLREYIGYVRPTVAPHLIVEVPLQPMLFF